MMQPVGGAPPQGPVHHVQVVQPPQTAIVYTAPQQPVSNVRENYAAKSSKVLGIMQVIHSSPSTHKMWQMLQLS